MRYSTEISEKFGSDKLNDISNSSEVDHLKLDKSAKSSFLIPPLENKGIAPINYNAVPASTPPSLNFMKPAAETVGTTDTLGPTSTQFFSGFSGFSGLTVPVPNVPVNPQKGTGGFGWNIPVQTPLSNSGVGSIGNSSLSGIVNSALSSVGNNGVGGDASTAGGEDEEGEPIMEAEKVLRNEEDKDEIVVDCPCKLFRFGNGEWIDVGKGTFRVTKCTETGKQRMLVRNSVGKIIFNAAFYKGMKLDQKGPGMLTFGAVVDQSGELKNFLLKIRDTFMSSVLQAMQVAISTF